MQRQHILVYLAALDEPLATGLESQINFQPYPGFNMAAAGYADFGTPEVSAGPGSERSIHAFSVVAMPCGSLFKGVAAHKACTDYYYCALRLQRVFSFFRVGL